MVGQHDDVHGEQFLWLVVLDVEACAYDDMVPQAVHELRLTDAPPLADVNKDATGAPP
jgi:hypothetical protein